MSLHADYVPLCAVEQQVRGHPVGVGGEAECAGCHGALCEGQPVTVLVYRRDDDERVAVPSIYCVQCAPARLDGESDQWLVDAELGIGQRNPDAWLMLVCPRAHGRRD